MGKMIKVDPHKPPVPWELEAKIEALQDAVSIGADSRGSIEFVGIAEGVEILLNEEGKLIGLEPNRRLGCDILVGVFYVVGVNETGMLINLTDEQMHHWRGSKTPLPMMS